MTRNREALLHQSVCRSCGARGNRLEQEAHRKVCDHADVVDSTRLERFWYWPFWQVTRPWLPRAWRGSDEYDRATVSLYLPLLGAFHFATGRTVSWRCEDCRCLNSPQHWCCYRCGAGQPEDDDA